MTVGSFPSFTFCPITVVRKQLIAQIPTLKSSSSLSPTSEQLVSFMDEEAGGTRARSSEKPQKRSREKKLLGVVKNGCC